MYKVIFLILSCLVSSESFSSSESDRVEESSYLYKISKDQRNSFIIGTIHDRPYDWLPESVRGFLEQATFKKLVVESNKTLTNKAFCHRVKNRMTPFVKHLKIKSFADLEFSPETNRIFYTGVEQGEKFLPKGFADENELVVDFMAFRLALANRWNSMDRHFSTRLQLSESYLESFKEFVQVYKSTIDKDDEDNLENLEELEDLLPFVEAQMSNSPCVEGNLDEIMMEESYENLNSELKRMILEKLQMFLTLQNENKNSDHEVREYFDTFLKKSCYYPKDKEAVNIDRNHLWIPRIFKYHQEHQGDVLFAVGFKHLYGEDNILALLEEKGFTIQRYEKTSKLENIEGNWKFTHDRTGWGDS